MGRDASEWKKTNSLRFEDVKRGRQYIKLGGSTILKLPVFVKRPKMKQKVSRRKERKRKERKRMKRRRKTNNDRSWDCA